MRLISMLKRIGLFVLPLIPLSTYSQIVFEKVYGEVYSDDTYHLESTSDGGFVAAGIDGQSTFDADLHLLRLDANGDTLWTFTHGGSVHDLSTAVTQDVTNSIYATGYTGSFGAGQYDCFLLKLNDHGDSLWFKTYGDADFQTPYDLVLTPDDGIAMIGQTSVGTSPGSQDVYLIKTDTSGNLLWDRTYGGTDLDLGLAIESTLDSGFIVAGYTESFGAGGYDGYVLRLNAAGDTLWTLVMGGVANDVFNDIKQTSDNGFIITGMNSSATGSGQIWLIKLDQMGNVDWEKTYGGADFEGGESVIESDYGGYVVVGTQTGSTGFGTDAFVMRFNDIGDSLCKIVIDNRYHDHGSDLVETGFDEFVGTGMTSAGPVDSNDVYLFKVSCQFPTSYHEERASNLRIYPNPVSNVLSVQVPEHKGMKVTLKVIDAIGREIHSIAESRSSFDLDVSELSAGHYFVVVQSDSELYHSKFFKN